MSYYSNEYYSDYLEHHGIKGQKWGVRRYQNPDGSLTPEGRERYYGYKEQAEKYGGHLTKDGKYKASNGVVIAKSRDSGVAALRKMSTSAVGRGLSSIGRSSMSKITNRSKVSIKDQERREREALKEYYKIGGDKFLEEYQKDFGDMKIEDSKTNSKKSEDPIDKYFKENPGKTYEDIYKEMGVNMDSEDPDDYREAEEKFKEKLKKQYESSDYHNTNGSIKAANPDKHSELAKEYNMTNDFANFLAKETGGIDQIDDSELLDLLAMEYEEDTGKKAYK